MKELIIEKKKDNPEIICKDGFISMKGNSILHDPKAFFLPVVQWIEYYIDIAPESTIVDINFEHIDTASVQSVFNILKMLKKTTKLNKTIVVNWYYQLDDPELLEIGEIIQNRLDLNLNFVETV